MAKFSGLDKLAVKGNLVDRLNEAAMAIQRAQRLALVAGDLSEITNDIGAANDGILATVTAVDPTAVDANGAFFSPEGVLFSDGYLYHFGYVRDGKLTVGVRGESGGQWFARGQGVIDDFGFLMTGIRYAMEHIATDPDGLNPRRARMEMIYPEGSTIPAFNISFIDATDYPELVTNGSLETGDTTGWAVTFGADADSSFSVEAMEGGDSGFAGKLERTAANGTMYVDSDTFAVTELTNYAINGAMAVEATGYVQGQIILRWLNSGGTLISDVLLANTALPAGNSSPLNTFSRTVRAPGGAVSAMIRVVKIGFVGVVWFDNLSVKYTSIVHNITIGDNGASLLEWGNPMTAGADQDTNDATSHQDQMQEVLVKEAIKVTAVAWDIRATGDYVLYQATEYGRALKTLWTGTIAAAGENTMVLATPLVLTAGQNFLLLRRSTGATTWWECNTPFGAVDADFRLQRISRDTGATWVDNQCAGVKLTYHPGVWS